MKFVDFGFPEDKILGTFRTNCPVWKVKIKGAKCKVSWALRFRLKFSQGLTNASDEHVLAPINMKFYSVDFEPLGIRTMQTGEMQSGTHSGRAVCVLENRAEENKHFRQDVDPDVITVNRKPSVENLTIVERSL